MTRFYSLTDDTDWHRRLQRGKARHLPIQAGEVAEYRRPLSWRLWEIAKLPLLIGGLSLIVMALGRASSWLM